MLLRSGVVARATIRGLSIEYEVVGEGRPWVVMPGGRLSKDTPGVRELASALADRKNRVLALTPDLLRRPGTGVPVRLFGRRAELPAGAFFLAVRARAPLLCSYFWEEDGRYRGRTDDPMEIVTTGDRDRDVAAMAQEWATRFERFVRAHPDMWLFWLDKRWRRWLMAGRDGSAR